MDKHRGVESKALDPSERTWMSAVPHAPRLTPNAPVPLHHPRIPRRRAAPRLLHERLDLGDLARGAGDPLEALVGDEVVVLDADADVGVAGDGVRDLRLELAVPRGVADDLERVAADVDARLECE